MNRRIPADVLPIEVAPRALRFAGFAFDPVRSELTGPDGAPIALRPKAELLLRHFLAHPGRLFAREELMDVLWPEAVVTDDSLVQCVGELRAALDDRAQSLIRTVPRRGYRFEAEVVPEAPPSPAAPWVPAAEASPSPPGVDEARDQASSPRPAPSRRRLAVALAAGLVVAVVAIAAWRWQHAPRLGIDEAIRARHVIAVMPLRVVDGGTPALRELADRVGDHIAVQIASRLGTRAIGRARTAPLADATLAQIAAALPASYVLTGRLSPAAGGSGAVDVEVQIVAIENGSVLGAERFALPPGADDEAVSGVGQEVMNFVRGRLGAFNDARLTRPGHVPDAADITILAWNELNRRRGPQQAAQTQARFAEALRQDPDSLIALEGLGAAYLQRRVPGVPLTPAEIAEGEQAIARAVRMAPEDATAAILWGSLQILKGRPDLAIPAFQKANRLMPGFGNGHLMLGRALLLGGRIAEVPAEAERAARLSSLMHDTSRTSAAWILAAEAALMENDDARALELARRAVAEHPNNREGHAVLAAVEALSGLPQEAATEMAAYRRSLPSATVATYDSFRPSTHPDYLAKRARFYEGLRLAGLPER